MQIRADDNLIGRITQLNSDLRRAKRVSIHKPQSFLPIHKKRSDSGQSGLPVIIFFNNNTGKQKGREIINNSSRPFISSIEIVVWTGTGKEFPSNHFLQFN